MGTGTPESLCQLSPPLHSTQPCHLHRQCSPATLLPSLFPGVWGKHCSYLHTPPLVLPGPILPYMGFRTHRYPPLGVVYWSFCLLQGKQLLTLVISGKGYILFPHPCSLLTTSQGFAHKGRGRWQGERMSGSHPFPRNWVNQGSRLNSAQPKPSVQAPSQAVSPGPPLAEVTTPPGNQELRRVSSVC